MKALKVQKTISIICCTIVLLFTLYGLSIGLSSIGATGFGALGVILIFPSLAAFLIILFDLLISLDVIKKGLIYSYISTILKALFIISSIKDTIYEINFQLQFGVSNLDHDLILTAMFIIAIIPSILNIIKLHKKRNIKQ